MSCWLLVTSCVAVLPCRGTPFLHTMNSLQTTSDCATLAGAVGLYLALTGKRLSKPADLLRTGIAMRYASSSDEHQMKDQRQSTRNILHAGAVGLYLALTGKRLSKPADLLGAGIATHFVRAERLPQLTVALGTRTLKRAVSKSLALSALEPILRQFDVSTWPTLVSIVPHRRHPPASHIGAAEGAII